MLSEPPGELQQWRLWFVSPLASRLLHVITAGLPLEGDSGTACTWISGLREEVRASPLLQKQRPHVVVRKRRCLAWVGLSGKGADHPGALDVPLGALAPSPVLFQLLHQY